MNKRVSEYFHKLQDLRTSNLVHVFLAVVSLLIKMSIVIGTITMDGLKSYLPKTGGLVALVILVWFISGCRLNKTRAPV